MVGFLQSDVGFINGIDNTENILKYQLYNNMDTFSAPVMTSTAKQEGRCCTLGVVIQKILTSTCVLI